MANAHRCEAIRQIEAGRVISRVEIYRSNLTGYWYVQLNMPYAVLDTSVGTRSPSAESSLRKGGGGGAGAEARLRIARRRR